MQNGNFSFAKQENNLHSMYWRPCNQKVHAHTHSKPLNKSDVNSTFPLKRLIKIIVGQ